jgi:hypothetical protein
MVHGNKLATHEGFEPGQIPELLLGVRFIGSNLLTGPLSKFSNLFITHYITRTSALLVPKIEYFLFRYIGRKKTIVPRSQRLSSFAPAYKI